LGIYFISDFVSKFFLNLVLMLIQWCDIYFDVLKTTSLRCFYVFELMKKRDMLTCLFNYCILIENNMWSLRCYMYLSHSTWQTIPMLSKNNRLVIYMSVITLVIYFGSSSNKKNTLVLVYDFMISVVLQLQFQKNNILTIYM